MLGKKLDSMIINGGYNRHHRGHRMSLALRIGPSQPVRISGRQPPGQQLMTRRVRRDSMFA